MQGLISNLIRPFRFKYSLFDLGPKITQKYQRNDTTILNDRNFKIQLSYYKNKKPSDICLVYAHCNSGSRIEGLQFVQSTMDQGWNLCLFDFTGSGISQGQFISLGYYQWIDLQTVISFVLKQGNNRINLWGRSMGAATIILYLGETKQIDNIISCVLDSPYSSLWKVVKQFGKSKTKIPQFIVEHVMQYLRSSIFKDHRFDIKQLDLLKKVHNIELPLMFIASTSDSFVNCSHAAELYKWAGSKQKILQYIEKQHNSPRQANTIEIGLGFMARSLNQKEQVKRELRILSKKKELCRKMNGHNMAELITKPVKGGSSSSSSLGNLGRFNSLYFNNNIHSNNSTINQYKDSVEATIQTIQTSPKHHQDKRSTSKNPHKIQQSIIKLAMPPRQILQHMRPAKTQQQYKMNTTTSHIQMSNIMNFDKENNVNASNNSKNQKEKEKDGEEGIHSFNSIITKRFHFDAPEYHEEGKKMEVGKSRERQRDVKSKTQKINIYLKNAAIQSPPRVGKFGGIKLVNKIKYRKQEKTNNNYQNDKEQQLRRIRQRVKTQVTPIYRESSQSDKKKKPQKQKPRKNQLYSSYSQIGMEQKQPEEPKWACTANSICKIAAVQSESKEIYMNKYRDYSKDRGIGQQYSQHKISCNQAWISKKQEFSPNGTAEFKHFHSIGELPSSVDQIGKKQPIKQGSHGLLGTQKIIKIQLDRNLFQTGIKKTQNKPTPMEQDNKWELEERHSNPVYSKLATPIIEINPNLSKFKLKQKKLLRFHQKQVESNSFL